MSTAWREATGSGRYLPITSLSVVWLRSKLTKCDRSRTIIVTHDAASPRSEAPYHANSPLKPAFASDLDEVVAESRIPLRIHAHTN